MRISDWSSDVCSSDLLADPFPAPSGTLPAAFLHFLPAVPPARRQRHGFGQPRGLGIAKNLADIDGAAIGHDAKPQLAVIADVGVGPGCEELLRRPSPPLDPRPPPRPPRKHTGEQ